MKKYIVKILLSFFIFSCASTVEEKNCGIFYIKNCSIHYVPSIESGNRRDDFSGANISLPQGTTNLTPPYSSDIKNLLTTYKLSLDSYSAALISITSFNIVLCCTCKKKFSDIKYGCYMIIALSPTDHHNFILNGVHATKNNIKNGVTKITGKKDVYQIREDYMPKSYCVYCAHKCGILKSEISHKNKVLIVPFLSIPSLKQEIDKEIELLRSDTDVDTINKHLNYLLLYYTPSNNNTSLEKYLMKMKISCALYLVNKANTRQKYENNNSFEIFADKVTNLFRKADSKISLSNSFVEEVLMDVRLKNFWLQIDLFNENELYPILKGLILRSLFEGNVYIKNFEGLPRVIFFQKKDYQDLVDAKNSLNNKILLMPTVEDFRSQVVNLTNLSDFYVEYFSEERIMMFKDTSLPIFFDSLVVVLHDLFHNFFAIQNYDTHMKMNLYSIISALFPELLLGVSKLDFKYAYEVVKLLIQVLSTTSIDYDYVSLLEKNATKLNGQQPNSKKQFLESLAIYPKILEFFYNNLTSNKLHDPEAIRLFIALTNNAIKSNQEWIFRINKWLELSPDKLIDFIKSMQLENINAEFFEVNISECLEQHQKSYQYNNSSNMLNANVLYNHLKKKEFFNKEMKSKAYSSLGKSTSSVDSNETISYSRRKKIFPSHDNKTHETNAKISNLENKVDALIELFSKNNKPEKTTELETPSKFSSEYESRIPNEGLPQYNINELSNQNAKVIKRERYHKEKKESHASTYKPFESNTAESIINKLADEQFTTDYEHTLTNTQKPKETLIHLKPIRSKINNFPHNNSNIYPENSYYRTQSYIPNQRNNFSPSMHTGTNSTSNNFHLQFPLEKQIHYEPNNRTSHYDKSEIIYSNNSEVPHSRSSSLRPNNIIHEQNKKFSVFSFSNNNHE